MPRRLPCSKTDVPTTRERERTAAPTRKAPSSAGRPASKPRRDAVVPLRSVAGPGPLVTAIASDDRGLPTVSSRLFQPISGSAGRITEGVTLAQIPPN